MTNPTDKDEDGYPWATEGQTAVSAPPTELERLRAEVAQWRTWGVIEVMIRNPNVDSFVKEKEAEITRLRAGRAADPEGWVLVPLVPTPEMIAAGGRALKNYIDGLSEYERAKLKPRKRANGDSAGYNIKPQTKAAVRWSEMLKAAPRADRAADSEAMSPAVAKAMEHFNAALLARRVLEAVEECAKVADEYAKYGWAMPADVAKAIRALGAASTLGDAVEKARGGPAPIEKKGFA
jgi:hypothetical protein